MMNKYFSDSITRRNFISWSLKHTLAMGLGASLINNPRAAYAISGNGIDEIEHIPGDVQWKTVSELSPQELSTYKMDLTLWEKTRRSEKYPYVAESMNPPYTASEIIYRLMMGQHLPWWSHESPLGGFSISNRGTVNRYQGQREVWSAFDPEAIEKYLYEWPEKKVCLWVQDKLYTPARKRYDTLLQSYYRSGETHKKSSDKWLYRNIIKKIYIVGEDYSDNYHEDMDYSYGDILMVPWYYTFSYVGIDTLYLNDGIRFPKGSTSIKKRDWGGNTVNMDVSKLKLMGENYPAYTNNGGVPCYVIEGKSNQNVYPQNASKILLWIDMYAKRELRRERYDLNNNLMAVTTAMYHQEMKDRGKWGYSILIYLGWKIKTDHMTANHYDFHRPPRTFKVNAEKPENYFKPDPMRMGSEMFKVPQSIMMPDEPEQFYLRPKLMLDKFPKTRSIVLPDNVVSLINNQNKKNQLVFL